MLILWGVAIVIVGFAVRLNPLLVVVLAAIATGLLAGLPRPGSTPCRSSPPPPSASAARCCAPASSPWAASR